MERERLGSRLGFILISAGCAIGCGNVWKFPWMTGQNGGGAFVLVYIICLIVLGLPVMTVEFSLGRASQASPVKMYQKLERKGTKWHYHGALAFLGNFALMAFYTVVTGWILYYFVSFLKGSSANLGFVEMITNPGINVGYLAAVIVIAFAVLSFELQSGLERITKYMMVALIILMVVLAFRSMTLEGAGEGLRFYLVPDFGKITPSVVVAAMNQAFFTLSLGIGSMAIFGSYIGKERSLMGESTNIILLDTLVAITAGLIIFPACTSLGLEVDAGPGLLFNTMGAVFNTMAGGRIWGTIFFLFMTFAAFSTVLAVCENILACVREVTGWSRKKGSLVCAIVIFCAALTTALGYSVLHFQPFAEGTAWLDFWDFIVSTNLLPLGALIMTLFCVSEKFGWGWENFKAEANSGEGLKVQDWMKPIFKYVVPIIVIALYIIGLMNFSWR
ncbi:MAG: sodium-dependent transporter [Firmicutes bacterium]|nr:sodium-dependent transporter [Bacillota bacterium]MBR6504051.1 sodium-dependent transporter [Bacillota bacterium]